MTFDEFVDSRLAALLRFAKVLCADRGLAEDVVQDVLMRAHSKWAHIGGLDMPEAYVRRMIVNEYLSWRRRLRIIPVAEVPDVPQADHSAQYADRQQLVTELGGCRVGSVSCWFCATTAVSAMQRSRKRWGVARAPCGRICRAD